MKAGEHCSCRFPSFKWVCWLLGRRGHARRLAGVGGGDKDFYFGRRGCIFVLTLVRDCGGGGSFGLVAFDNVFAGVRVFFALSAVALFLSKSAGRPFYC